MHPLDTPSLTPNNQPRPALKGLHVSMVTKKLHCKHAQEKERW